MDIVNNLFFHFIRTFVDIVKFWYLLVFVEENQVAWLETVLSLWIGKGFSTFIQQLATVLVG